VYFLSKEQADADSREEIKNSAKLNAYVKQAQYTETGDEQNDDIFAKCVHLKPKNTAFFRKCFNFAPVNKHITSTTS
jgi:hypothetical protein